MLFSSFISHMWRQLSEASMLLDYPTNQQSFRNSWEDESACWISSRACRRLFSDTHLPEQLGAENRSLARGRGWLGSGSGALLRCHCSPRCFSFDSLFVTRRDCQLCVEHRWERNFLQQTEKNGGGNCMQVFKENRCTATVWVITCARMQIQACLTTKSLWDTEKPTHTLLVDAAFRLERELQLPHTPTSAVLHSFVWSVSLQAASPGTFHTSSTKCSLMLPFLNDSVCPWCFCGKPLFFVKNWVHFRLLWCSSKVKIWRPKIWCYFCLFTHTHTHIYLYIF